jgi:hypothetical protein
MQSKEKLITLCGLSKEETELDFSGQDLGAGDVVLIANDIIDMGAMTKLNLSRNEIQGAEAGKALGDAIKGNTVLKELDISGDSYNKCDVEFVKPFAVGLHDNGAILSVNLLKNSIGVGQAKDLVAILKAHPTLKSLCGNKGNETELDMSGKMDGAEDAIMVAAEVVDNRAISTFTFSGDYEESDPVTMETTMTETDFSGKNLGVSGGMMVAAFLPKCQ